MLGRRSGRVGLVCLALLGGCGPDAEPAEAGKVAKPHGEVHAIDSTLASRLPPGATMEQAEEGRQLFITCAVCHGLDARGTQLGPSLRDDRWVDVASATPEEIERVIREGVAEPGEFSNPMPVMGGGSFTPEELRALAVYVYLVGEEGGGAAADSTRGDLARADSTAS